MKFFEGVMWEENPFEIEIDYECSQYSGNPCKHCYDFTDKKSKRFDGRENIEKIWKNPAVVIVKNEGGYNSTGLCIKCLMEAIQTNFIQQRLSASPSGHTSTSDNRKRCVKWRGVV